LFAVTSHSDLWICRLEETEGEELIVAGRSTHTYSSWTFLKADRSPVPFNPTPLNFFHRYSRKAMEPDSIENSSPRYLQEPVAVIGLACRLPGDCNSPTALWKFLDRGGVAHNEAPATRFNLKIHHDDYRKPKTMRSPGGMFLENIDPQDFDAQFFGISGVDVMAMDPQQRQLLEVVYECLENAGLTLEGLDGKPVGCFVGSFAVGMSSTIL